MKIRFRYNSLFILSCVLFLITFIQQTQIELLNNKLESKYAKVEDVKARSEYMNFQMSKIEIHALDAFAIAETAYDMAFERTSKWSWVEGRTTEEIDSVLCGLKDIPEWSGDTE